MKIEFKILYGLKCAVDLALVIVWIEIRALLVENETWSKPWYLELWNKLAPKILHYKTCEFNVRIIFALAQSSPLISIIFQLICNLTLLDFNSHFCYSRNSKRCRIKITHRYLEDQWFNWISCCRTQSRIIKNYQWLIYCRLLPMST